MGVWYDDGLRALGESNNRMDQVGRQEKGFGEKTCRRW
jgi:hypothetical protein